MAASRRKSIHKLGNVAIGRSGDLTDGTSDAAMMMQRSNAAPVATLARGVIQADTPQKLSYREAEGSSIRYECGVDGVFFQRDAPRAVAGGTTPQDTSVSPTTAPGSGFVAFSALDEPAPQEDRPSESGGVSPRSGGTSPDHPAAKGSSAPPSRSPSRGAEDPDVAIRDVSALWPATEHRWADLFGAAAAEMEAMWDGEDVNWIVDGATDAGSFSAVFGPPPVPAAPKGTGGSRESFSKKGGGRGRAATPKGAAKSKRGGLASLLRENSGHGSGAMAPAGPAFDSKTEGLLFEAMRYVLDGAAARDMPGHYSVTVAASAALISTSDRVPEDRRAVDLSTGTSLPSVLGSSLGEQLKTAGGGGGGGASSGPAAKNRRSSFRAMALAALPGATPNKEGGRKRATFGDSVDDVDSDDGARTSKDNDTATLTSGKSGRYTGGSIALRASSAGLPAVVDTKPSSKRHAEATTYVRNLRVVPVATLTDLKGLRNLWASKALELIEEGQTDIFAGDADFGTVAHDESGNDMDNGSDVGLKSGGGPMALVTLTVTQRCSIAPTKISQIRFYVVDGAAVVPGYHEVLRVLRTHESLPRTLPTATLRDAIVRLLVAGASKKERSHHILLECFSVAHAIDALEAVAAARAEEVQTNIVTTSAGVSSIAYQLTDERRSLRALRRELTTEVQKLREKTEHAERVVSSLSRAAYGSRSDMAASRVSHPGHDDDDDERTVSAISDSETESDADSLTPSIAEEFATRQRHQDQYLEDRRTVVKKQAATLAQCQKTWQEASSRGLELRKEIAQVRKAMEESRHCEERARMAREAEFATEMARLQRSDDQDSSSVITPTRSRLQRVQSMASANKSSTSIAASLAASSPTAASRQQNERVGKLRRRLLMADEEAQANDRKRALAFSARERQLEQMLKDQRRELGEVETAAAARAKQHVTARHEYMMINARLFELSVSYLRVMTLYRNHYGARFPDFLKQEDMPPEKRHPAAGSRAPTPLERPGSATFHRSVSTVFPSASRGGARTPQLEGGKVRAPRLQPRKKVLATAGSDVSSRDVAFPNSSCDPVLQGSVEGGTLAKRSPAAVKESLKAAFALLWNERGLDERTCPPLQAVHDDLLLFPVTFSCPSRGY